MNTSSYLKLSPINTSRYLQKMLKYSLFFWHNFSKIELVCLFIRFSIPQLMIALSIGYDIVLFPVVDNTVFP